MSEELKVEKTQRGFQRIEFTDSNGKSCSLQQSSLATDDCIWLGCNEIGLMEFVAGRQPAWQEIDTTFSLSHHWNANTRMHLNREQVSALLPHLMEFVFSGSLEVEDEDPEEIRQVLLDAVKNWQAKQE